MRTITIKQFNQQTIDIEKIRAVAANPSLSADDVFDFPKFVIARSGRNHNRTDITGDAQKSAVNEWVGKPVYFKDHELKSDNQIGRIYDSWTEDKDGETITYGRAFAVKCKEDEDLHKKIKNRQHSEMSCGYEPVKSQCNKCGADTLNSHCPTHEKMPDYCARDMEFHPDHVSFTGNPAVEGAGLCNHSREEHLTESLSNARLMADGQLFRDWTRAEFSKWFRLNNKTTSAEEIESLTDRLTAKEMLTFARIEQSRFQEVIPSGQQQLTAPESSDVESPRSAEEIKQSFRKGNTI